MAEETGEANPAKVLANMSKEQAQRVFTNKMKMDKFDDDMKKRLVPFEAGEILLDDVPFVVALKDVFRGERCDCCLKHPDSSNIKGVKSCSRCKYVFYCGKECQKQDWKLHKNECLRISTLSSIDHSLVPKLVNQFTRMLARTIDLDQMGATKIQSPFYKRTFWDLESHADDIKKDALRVKKVDIAIDVLEHFMKTPDPNVMLHYNRDKMIELYGCLSINCHGITDQLGAADGNEIATGLYLDVSRLDHSCRPNAAITYTGSRARVHILQESKADNDQGIRPNGMSYFKISYNVTDMIQQVPAPIRKEHVKGLYYFDCDCEWCSSHDDTYFVARCPKCDHHQRCNPSQGPGAACGHQTTGEERTHHQEACEAVNSKLTEVTKLVEAKDEDGILAQVKGWSDHLVMPMRHISPSDKHLFELVMKMITAAYLVCPIDFKTCLYKDAPEFNTVVLEAMSKLGKVLMKIMEMQRNQAIIGFFSQVFLAIAGAQKKLNLVDESLETLRFFRDATRVMKGDNHPYFRMLEIYIAEMNSKHFLKARPASFKKKQIGRSNEEEADVLLLGAISKLEKLLGPIEYLEQLKALREAVPLPDEKRGKDS